MDRARSSRDDGARPCWRTAAACQDRNHCGFGSPAGLHRFPTTSFIETVLPAEPMSVFRPLILLFAPLLFSAGFAASTAQPAKAAAAAASPAVITTIADAFARWPELTT